MLSDDRFVSSKVPQESFCKPRRIPHRCNQLDLADLRNHDVRQSLDVAIRSLEEKPLQSNEITGEAEVDNLATAIGQPLVRAYPAFVKYVADGRALTFVGRVPSA